MTNSKMIRQTKSLNPKDVSKQWVLVDAENVVLGRLASNVSKILRGKHKVNYTPHVDCGDNVIIINAEKVKLTGNKLSDKKYYWHTGYPGGIKETTAKKIIEGKNPDKIIRLAVQRMIPKGPLGRQQISNMKVYCGESHPHDSQSPKKFNIIDMI
tara:strand:- start:184 stop:648 length:465 start_codon:yes stop_codon:yes gene_type:complete